MDYQRVIESFHILWGNFPERARLIQKDRTVLAVNKAAEAEGLQPGVRCIDTPPREAHAGCRANAVLRTGTGTSCPSADGSRMRYWVPVEGYGDLFVHFSLPLNP